MLFNSWIFVALVAVTFSVYYFRPIHWAQTYVLIIASIVFYTNSQPWLLILLLCSAVVTALASFFVLNRKPPKFWAVSGVVINLSTLCLFKYYGLIALSIETYFLQSGASIGSVLLMLPLPIGVSFYTFQGISLMVDTFKVGSLHSYPRSFREHFRDVILYIIFFPQLVAGPIVKAHDFMPQIGRKYLSDVDWDKVLSHVIIGYFFKMVVADNLAQHTIMISSQGIEFLSSLTLLILLFGYSMQIFADFAGYTMIAIGIAALFGYQIPKNFDFPYISKSLAEFWRRWHISLSAFLKEYLYFPLGGNTKGNIRTYFNLLIVMFLGGLWHGAAWSYAVWGLWHGVGLVVERLFLNSSFYKTKNIFVEALRLSMVFGFVSFGWLLFILPDFQQALEYIYAIINNFIDGEHARFHIHMSFIILLFSLPVFIYHVGYLVYERYKFSFSRSHILGVLCVMILLNSGTSDVFIYFQF